MAVIGIDLGTTNSLVSVYRNGKVELIPNRLGEYLTPSVVSIDDKGEICVGAVARERLVSHPELTAACFKRFMGTKKEFRLGDKVFSPQELSAMVLRRFKLDAESYLGEPVTEAIISVPAYFDENQRCATKEAGLMADLKVERLINEPSAAALACRQDQPEEDRTYLVFDFGGGTLDVSIVDCFDNVVEIVAVSGDNNLGGSDFDLRIAEYFCMKHDFSYAALPPQQQAILLRLAEKSKRELTDQKASLLQMELDQKDYAVFLTNPELVQVCGMLFERITTVTDRALRDARRTIEDIDEIILVGGSSKMPSIQYYLQTQLGKKPTVIGSPDEIVALGAGVFAGIKERKQELKDILLTDICPFTLGVEVVNYANPDRTIMSPIIERNSILPTSKRSFYTNTHDDQEQVEMGIYQGEAYYCDENLKLGKMELEIMKLPKGQVQLEVCFSYDINGILNIEIIDHNKNERQEKVILNENLKLSEQEIQEKLQALKAYKMYNSGSEAVTLVLARGQRLYAEFTGEKRAQIIVIMRQLEMEVRQGNDQLALLACKKATSLFDQLEETQDIL